MQQNTQRVAFAEIYTHPQLLHRPASKNFRNGRRRSRQLRRNFRNFAENLQSCRGSFAAGSRRNFAPKYATWSIWPDLPAPLAFAPPRVAKFSKRSPKKSTASPNFRQISTQTCNLAGARSRLDGGHILHQNTQRAALAEIYPQPQLLHRPASRNFRNGRRRSRQLRRIFGKFRRKLAILPGLVLGWMEAIFCTKIRNVQLLPRSTRNPSFCTGPRRKFFETVREEVASVAEISKNF